MRRWTVEQKTGKGWEVVSDHEGPDALPDAISMWLQCSRDGDARLTVSTVPDWPQRRL